MWVEVGVECRRWEGIEVRMQRLVIAISIEPYQKCTSPTAEREHVNL